MNRRTNLFIIILFVSTGMFHAKSQTTETNYDESKVKPYNLPTILGVDKNRTIKTKTDWEKYGRPATISLFEKWVYGKAPQQKTKATYHLDEMSERALEGKAIRKQITIYLSEDKKQKIRLLLYLPKSTDKVPVFLSLNYFGNQAVHHDPAIIITDQWIRNDSIITNHKADESTRGKHAFRFSIDSMISRGYGLATFYYGDIDPDYDDGFQNGIHPMFYKKGQIKPDSGEWATIGAWAWGLSRAMDYLETDKLIDAKKVIVVGHSRQGKTSLWAGVQDIRFAIVIANDAGEGGVSLSRRNFGETIADLEKNVPYWFCSNLALFKNDPSKLPFDFHQLLACVAPRPLYIASASEDLWADPYGEYLSAYHASEVYRLYGLQGLDSTEFPGVENPIVNRYIGHHVRKGKHNILEYDWLRFMDFADYHFKKK